MYLYIRFYAMQLACGSTLDTDMCGEMIACVCHFWGEKEGTGDRGGASGGVPSDGGLRIRS
jgi:hypothetical protein